MSVQEAFEILQIKRTNDRRKIKIAYKRLLPSYNPEDDEKAFLRFRQAYEIADKYAVTIGDDEEAAEDTEEMFASMQMDELRELESEQADTLVEDILLTEVLKQFASVKDETEESRLEIVTECIENIYQSLEKRNDIHAWEEVFNNDVFLSLEYSYAAKKRVIEILTDKYMLKSSVIKYIHEQMEQTDQSNNLWNWFSPHYVCFWLNKKRDTAGYTDFLFEDIRMTDELNVVNDLSELWRIVTSKEDYETTILMDKLSDIFGVNDVLSATQYVDELMNRYPQSLFLKIMTIYIYQKYEKTIDLRDERIRELDSEVLEIFLNQYIYDDIFMFWQQGYMNSTKWSEDEKQFLRYSKLGEYFLVRKYISENLSKLELLKKETDRMLILAHLDILRAWDAQKKREAVKMWHQAEEKLQIVLQKEPENKSALIMDMAVGVELYDFDRVAAGYEKVKEQMCKNPFIYVFMAKNYIAAGRTEEAKEVFALAEQNNIEDYELGIMHLHFRKRYDFIDGYDLDGALGEGHALIEDMFRNGVCGELLAEMYYSIGCLVYCDGRYTNAYEYADWALEICKKPKYYFLKAADNVLNGKCNYEAALVLFEEVYRLKNEWDDEESDNPRFAEEVDYDNDMFLGSTYTTDLHTLYAHLGYCCEKMEMIFEAMNYYKKALLIKSNVLKIAAAFARTAEILLQEEMIQVEEVEQSVQEFSDVTLESYPCKFLRAVLAYEQGSEEFALKLATEITKMKMPKFHGEQAFLEDYRKFAHYLKAKIYIKREKYQMAKMSLRMLGEKEESKIAENRERMRNIYEEVLLNCYESYDIE